MTPWGLGLWLLLFTSESPAPATGTSSTNTWKKFYTYTHTHTHTHRKETKNEKSVPVIITFFLSLPAIYLHNIWPWVCENLENRTQRWQKFNLAYQLRGLVVVVYTPYRGGFSGCVCIQQEWVSQLVRTACHRWEKGHATLLLSQESSNLSTR